MKDLSFFLATDECGAHGTQITCGVVVGGGGVLVPRFPLFLGKRSLAASSLQLAANF